MSLDQLAIAFRDPSFLVLSGFVLAGALALLWRIIRFCWQVYVPPFPEVDIAPPGAGGYWCVVCGRFLPANENSLIIHCGKNIENRTWNTNHRGPLLIQASNECSRTTYDAVGQFIAERGIELLEPMPWYTALPLGCILGQVNVVDCVRSHDSPWFVGPVGFVLEAPKPLPHVRCKGKLGMFDAPPEVLRSLQIQ